MELFAMCSLVLLLLLLLPPPAACFCGPSDRELILLAFRSVSGFQLPDPAAHGPDCSISLPSRNLSGAVSWMHLRNVSAIRALDLSGNAIRGSIPGGFWSSPALLHVNLADNTLGGALRTAGLAALPRLEVLDLSRNSLGFVPPGLDKLRRLRQLDLSHNPMKPEGFTPLVPDTSGALQPEAVRKLGELASVEGGSLHFVSAATVAHKSSPHHSPVIHHHKSLIKGKARIILLAIVLSIVFGLLLVIAIIYCWVMMVDKRKGRGGGGGGGSSAAHGVGGEGEVTGNGGAVQRAGNDAGVPEGVSADKEQFQQHS
ncbi:hypothetical protein OPV22_006229 [Ensete ventricosum]|uniref:Leucine-rich repeat-containing N-terminal plant-type domain-containing protein n=1 Tax=Ensete ventricosum TaxID=4639 RepID=A0AAV8RP93_ENSVE|nr:hypothetical protein OPV22_006229 [Ensete ventricosum]